MRSLSYSYSLKWKREKNMPFEIKQIYFHHVEHFRTIQSFWIHLFSGKKKFYIGKYYNTITGALFLNIYNNSPKLKVTWAFLKFLPNLFQPCNRRLLRNILNNILFPVSPPTPATSGTFFSELPFNTRKLSIPFN